MSINNKHGGSSRLPSGGSRRLNGGRPRRVPMTSWGDVSRTAPSSPRQSDPGPETESLPPLKTAAELPTPKPAEWMNESAARHLEARPFIMPKWPTWIGLACAVIGSVVVQPIITRIYDATKLSLEPWADLAVRAFVVVMIVVLIAGYTRGLKQAYRDQIPTAAHYGIGITKSKFEVRGKEVSLVLMNDENLRRVLSHLIVQGKGNMNVRGFVPDHWIIGAFHKHRGRALLLERRLLVIAWLLLNAAYVWATLNGLFNGMTGHFSAELPHPLVVTLCSGLVLWLYLAIRWVQWQSWSYIITDVRTYTIVEWPPALFWLESRVLPIPHNKLTSCYAKSPTGFFEKTLSMMFGEGYGTVDYNSLSDDDNFLRNMLLMPWHELIVAFYNGGDAPIIL